MQLRIEHLVAAHDGDADRHGDVPGAADRARHDLAGHRDFMVIMPPARLQLRVTSVIEAW